VDPRERTRRPSAGTCVALLRRSGLGDHERTPVVDNDAQPWTEDATNKVGRDDVADLAVAHDHAVREQHDSRREGRGEVEVVQDGHDGQAANESEGRDAVERRALVRRVEMRGRLVEKQHSCLLSQRHRQHGTLALAARHAVDATVGQLRGTDVVEGTSDGARVVRAERPERSEPRCSSERDDLADREREERLEDLRHDRDVSCDRAAVQRRDVDPVDRHAARRRPQQTAQDAQERGFPGAVRTDERDELAGARDEIDPAKHLAILVARADRARDDAAHTMTRLERTSSARKNGAPTSPVMTPTGSSAGASAVRAPRSASTSAIAPAGMLATMSRRCVAPRRKRSACGITRPTNPMSPAIATAAPVRSAVVASTSAVVRSRSMPSAAAVSSPNAYASMRGASRTAPMMPIATTTATTASSFQLITEMPPCSQPSTA